MTRQAADLELSLRSAQAPTLDASASGGADRHMLITGSRDAIFHGYQLDLAALVKLARARLNRNFTEQECQVYLHQATCPK